MKHANITSLTNITISGIPCLIEVTATGYALYDRKGYRAAWLEKKMSNRDHAAVDALVKTASVKPASKQEAAQAIFNRMNGTAVPYAIAKTIAAELNIGVPNANYYVQRFLGKR